MTSQQPAESSANQSLAKTGGIFLDRAQAEAAQHVLIEAGIPAEGLSIQASAIDPNPPLSKSKGAKSARSGAITGGLFGSIVAVLLSFSAQNFPGDSPVSFAGSSQAGIVIGIIGVAAGALGGALVGLLTGSSAPSENADPRPNTKYLLLIQAQAEDLGKVRDLVRQQGGEIQI